MIGTLAHDLISLFFPRFCATCEKPLIRSEQLLCTECRVKIPRVRRDPLTLKRLEERLHGSVNFMHVTAYYKFHKSGLTQQFLHKMKYADRPDIASQAGRWFGAELETTFPAGTFDLVVPVPLHRSKERRRGYNQSARIAEGVAWSTGIPLKPALQRIRKGDSQTHKSRIERWNNVAGIFRIQHRDLVAGKHILLVDDVVTTGATLESCGSTLLDAGASQVSAAALAMAM